MVFAQGPGNMDILCGPASAPLHKVPEEETGVGVVHGQAVMWKRK